MQAVRHIAADGVDRVIEVSLSDNIDFDIAIVANDAVVAAYASRADRPEVPFWPLLFANTTLRMMGSGAFSRRHRTGPRSRRCRRAQANPSDPPVTGASVPKLLLPAAFGEQR